MHAGRMERPRSPAFAFDDELDEAAAARRDYDNLMRRFLTSQHQLYVQNMHLNDIYHTLRRRGVATLRFASGATVDLGILHGLGLPLVEYESGRPVEFLSHADNKRALGPVRQSSRHDCKNKLPPATRYSQRSMLNFNGNLCNGDAYHSVPQPHELQKPQQQQQQHRQRHFDRQPHSARPDLALVGCYDRMHSERHASKKHSEEGIYLSVFADLADFRPQSSSVSSGMARQKEMDDYLTWLRSEDSNRKVLTPGPERRRPDEQHDGHEPLYTSNIDLADKPMANRSAGAMLLAAPLVDPALCASDRQRRASIADLVGQRLRDRDRGDNNTAAGSASVQLRRKASVWKAAAALGALTRPLHNQRRTKRKTQIDEAFAAAHAVKLKNHNAQQARTEKRWLFPLRVKAPPPPDMVAKLI